MSDEEQSASSAEADSSGSPEPQEESSGQSTPEEVERFWRNRQSQSDKAHAATERVLREQIAALTGAQPPKGATGAGDDPRDAAIAELRKELSLERQSRVVDTRKTRYPEATAALGDDSIIAQFDEARLAGMEARLTDGTPTRASTPQANNTQRRVASPTGTKSLEEMTSAELKKQLERESAGYLASLEAEGRR